MNKSANLKAIANKQSTQVKLLDDTDDGIAYNSFNLLEILGQGTFGKVFKVTKKDSGGDPKMEKEFAMKVLKKAFLVKNNHLKYAITEANILKQSNHPYVIKLHYSF